MEITQTLNRLFRAAQCLEGEVELLAARHAEQKIPNPDGRKTFFRQVAKRVIVSLRLRHRLAFNF